MTALGRVVFRLRAFAALFGWLLRLLLRSARRHTVAAFALSLLGTATHVSAIGIFLSFVHAQTKGGVLHFGPFRLSASTEFVSLALWSAAVLLMAFLTAAATYKSATLTFEAGRRAARAFLHQAVMVFTDSQLAHNELLSSPEGRAMARRAFFGDSVVLIRSAVVGSGLLAPLLLFGLAAAALLRLNATLTAGIGLPLVLFSVLLWRHNRRVVAAARVYKQFISQRSRGLKDVFDHLSQTQSDERQASAMLDTALNDPATSGFERAIGRIMLRGQKVHYLRLLFLGVVLSGLLFAWGAFQSSEAASWSALITYVVSLRYAVTTMGSVATSITSIARYVPYMERMRALTTERPSPSSGDARLDPVVRASTPRLPGSATEQVLRPGDVLACSHSLRLDAFAVPSFLEKLTGSPDEAAELASQTFYSGSAPPQPFGPDGSGAGLDPAAADSDEGTRRFLEVIGQASGDESQAGQGPSPELLSYALLLMPGLLAGRRVFVLDWASVRELPRDSQKAILDLLSDRVTILVLRTLPTKLPSAAGSLAIVDAERVLGLGDRAWYAGLDREHPLLDGFRAQAELAAQEPDDDLDDDVAFE